MQLEFRYEETVDPSHDTADQQYDQDHQRDRKYRKVREHLGGISHGLHRDAVIHAVSPHRPVDVGNLSLRYILQYHRQWEGSPRQADDVDNGSADRKLSSDVSVNNCYDQQDV